MTYSTIIVFKRSIEKDGKLNIIAKSAKFIETETQFIDYNKINDYLKYDNSNKNFNIIEIGTNLDKNTNLADFTDMEKLESTIDKTIQNRYETKDIELNILRYDKFSVHSININDLIYDYYFNNKNSIIFNLFKSHNSDKYLLIFREME
jgi:hypothetical protein